MILRSKSKFIAILLFVGGFFPMGATAQLNLKAYPTYQGNDLGLTYSSKKSVFKVWSPLAQDLILWLYNEGTGGKTIDKVSMKPSSSGIWTAELNGNQAGKFYTFQAKFDNVWKAEAIDPYAKAVGANGKRAAIVDMAMTQPKGWETDQSPALKNAQDAVIYELHVRDATIANSSGVNSKHQGKFLGLAESGTKNSAGLKTGLDHIRDLGVTHVHLLPIFDFNSIDETTNKPAYNWGYDPLNYNALEGSYSTNPNDASARIHEFKTLVKAFHENGLGVVMDVVYNHTALSDNSYFNQLVPQYYYRQKADGTFSNASACGNETASERSMVRKFIIESMKHWVQEYHIDGFRIDLMGIHDIETMNEMATELRKIKPEILLYGEGWTAGDSPLPENNRSLKKYAHRLHNIAVFSDDLRDGLKGSVFEHQDRGFVSGKAGTEESIKFGIVGATQHPQINYTLVNYSKSPYAANAAQVINYAECHDNHTLWDRLSKSVPDATEADKIKMHTLANTIVFTSQGIPFLHAGAEFLRTKNGIENSFESSDEINRLDWDRKTTHKTVFEFYKRLVQLRKNHAAFRMAHPEDIAKHLTFIPTQSGVVAYHLKQANQDKWEDILVIFNANVEPIDFELPKGKWKMVLNGQNINENGIGRKIQNRLNVPAISANILVR